MDLSPFINSSNLETILFNNITEKPPISDENLNIFLKRIMECLYYIIETNYEIDDFLLETLLSFKNFLILKNPKPNSGRCIRDNFSKFSRKSIMIVLSFINKIRLDSKITDFKKNIENVSTNPKLPKEFIIYKNVPTEFKSLWDLTQEIIQFNLHINNFVYTPEIELYWESLCSRIFTFIINSENIKDGDYEYDFPMFFDIYNQNDEKMDFKEEKTRKYYLNPEGLRYEISDDFIDLKEIFFFHYFKKFYICSSKFYIDDTCVPKIEDIFMENLIDKIKEILKNRQFVISTESLISSKLPHWLILPYEEDYYLHTAANFSSSNPIKILNALRPSELVKYLEVITQSSGLFKFFSRRLENFFHYKNTIEFDIVFERVCINVFSYLLGKETGVNLDQYVIYENEIDLPIKLASANKFYDKKFPYMVQTYRGWCLWDFIANKFIRYKTSMECFIAWLISLNLVNEDELENLNDSSLLKGFYLIKTSFSSIIFK